MHPIENKTDMELIWAKLVMASFKVANPDDMDALPTWNWLTVNKYGIGYLNVKPEDTPKFCRLFKAFRLEMCGRKYTFEALPFEGHEKKIGRAHV